MSNVTDQDVERMAERLHEAADQLVAHPDGSPEHTRAVRTWNRRRAALYRLAAVVYRQEGYL